MYINHAFRNFVTPQMNKQVKYIWEVHVFGVIENIQANKQLQFFSKLCLRKTELGWAELSYTNIATNGLVVF